MKLRVVQLSTPTCAPCRNALMVLPEIVQNMEFKYEYVDVTAPLEDPHLAPIIQTVRTVPTFLIIDGMEIIGKKQGFSMGPQGIKDFKQWLRAYIKNDLIEDAEIITDEEE